MWQIVCIDMQAHAYTQLSSSVYPRSFIYLDDIKDEIFIQQVPTDHWLCGLSSCSFPLNGRDSVPGHWNLGIRPQDRGWWAMSKVEWHIGMTAAQPSLLTLRFSLSKWAASLWWKATGKVDIKRKGGESNRRRKQQLKSIEVGKIDQWPQEQSILIMVIKSCQSILWILNLVDWRQQVCFHVPSPFYLLQHSDTNEHSVLRLHYCFTSFELQMLW